MSKAPALQFYPGDVQRDTALGSVSLAAYGLWHRMMWVMFDGKPFGHLSVNGSVIPDANLARLLRVTDQELSDGIKELEDAGVFSRTHEGVIYSRRMVRDAKRRETNAENGSKGGNPRLSKSVIQKDKRKDIPLVADADSSIVLNSSGKERARAKVEPLPFPSDEFAQAVSRWELHRKEKGHKMTPSTRVAWLKKCAAMGEARAIAAIDHSIAQGWTGMYEPTNGTHAATLLTADPKKSIPAKLT